MDETPTAELVLVRLILKTDMFSRVLKYVKYVSLAGLVVAMADLS